MGLSSFDWQYRAACAGMPTDLFFGDGRAGRKPTASTHLTGDQTEATQDNIRALRVCAMCPVKQECAQFADDNDIRYGVWGGQIRVTRPDRHNQQEEGAA